MVSDLVGIGKTTEGIAKLISTVKDWYIWAKEPERFQKQIRFLKDNGLIGKSISYESGDFSLKIDNIEQNLNEEYYRKIAIQSKEHQAIKEQTNIDKVLISSVDFLEKTSDVSDEKVAEEWLANFFEHAKFANSEYMQKLWGKILADEVKQPNTFSIRALSVLRFLRKSDAENFSKLRKLVLSNINNNYNMIFFDRDYFYQKLNIRDSDISYLEELGLIKKPNGFSYPPIIENESTAIFTYSEKKVFICQGSNDMALVFSYINIPFIGLTQLGNELLKLIEPYYCIDYVKKINNILNGLDENKYGKCKFQLADFSVIKRYNSKWEINPSEFVDVNEYLSKF